MIRAVIFDMFETLITHYNSPLYFGAQMAADAGIPEDKFQSLWRPTESDRTIGKVTLEEVVALILKENDCYSDALLKKIADKRIATKEACFEHLHPEILPMLSSLKEKGLKIGLISNCFSEETDVIRRSVLFSYFDAACLSYEQGVQKPDQEIFRRCMEELSVTPEVCIYIGDGGSRELETARALGMQPLQAVWYFKEGKNQPAKRKEEFIPLETPLDVLKYLGKKDFNAMLHNNKDMPKIQIITDEKSIEKYGGNRMYFAPPIDYDKVMKQIPYGKLITIGKIREYFAEVSGADFTEPFTAGIFVSIAAWASFQRADDETPYWRTLKANGELNEKYPGGIEAQKEKLEAEGHTIIQKGRKNIKYYVKDFEKAIFEISK